MPITPRFALIFTIFSITTTIFGTPPWQDEYQTALSALRDKNYKLAVVMLSDISKKSEASVGTEGIFYHLGLAYYGLEKFSEAKVSFERVLKINSNSAFFARSMYFRGEIFREKK